MATEIMLSEMVSAPPNFRKVGHFSDQSHPCLIILYCIFFFALVQSIPSSANAQTLRSATSSEIRHIREGWKDTEHAVPRLDNFECKEFRFRLIFKVASSLSKKEVVCSALSYSKDTGEYRELNYYKVNGNLVPVSIFGNKNNNDANHIIFLTGGPRGNKLGPNRLIEHLVGTGYTVFVPIYQGQVETYYPSEDISEAIAQVRRLRAILNDGLTAIIGASAGGYLAEAACSDGCDVPLILIAPLLRSPKSQLSDSRKLKDPEMGNECLVSSNTDKQMCASPLALARSFWGIWRNRSLGESIRRGINQRRTTVIVSKNDRVVYSKSQISYLKSINVRVRMLKHLTHSNMLNSREVWESVDIALATYGSR